MRLALFTALVFATGPAFAQQPQPATSGADVQLPGELADPQLPARIARMGQALGKAMLDMPIGEIEAAAEGREPTTADKRRTVGSASRAQDPNFDRNFERELATSGPMLEAATRALVASLPAMMQGLEQAWRALEAAAENLPPPPAPTR